MDSKIKEFVDSVLAERATTPKELIREFDGGVCEFFGTKLPKRINMESVYFSRGANVCMGASRTFGLGTAEEKEALKELMRRMKSTA